MWPSSMLVTAERDGYIAVRAGAISYSLRIMPETGKIRQMTATGDRYTVVRVCLRIPKANSPAAIYLYQSRSRVTFLDARSVTSFDFAVLCATLCPLW